MKQKINIYSKPVSRYFIQQLLEDYDLVFKNTYEFIHFDRSENLGIIFLAENDDRKNLEKINQDHLCIVTDVTNIPKNNNITYLQSPVSVTKIKNQIKKILSNKSIIFEDIEIKDKKITNKINKSFCYLTDIEKKILSYLIKSKTCNKDEIKKNILKIKSSIETNSIESHLTRIRKKLDKIETMVKIQSKNDFLSIFINQKNLDW